MNFFFRTSLARIYIFFTSPTRQPPPPPPISFFNGPSLSTRQHTMAANEGVTKVIASFYRVDLDVVFLGLSYYLRPNIAPANFFWVFTLSWPGFPETFRLLPQISVDIAKTSERCRQCPQKKFRRRLRSPKVILKTTILTCFNFVRTQKKDTIKVII